MCGKFGLTVHVFGFVVQFCLPITTDFTPMCPAYLFNGVRRSMHAWLHNLTIFQSISLKKARKDESI